jgi:MoxR-like ATPase
MAQKIESMTLSPSQCAVAIRTMIPTKRALFMWGPPGVSKSQTAQQVATGLNCAFIDLRLSQIDPVDLRGVPYPTKIGGVEGVRWSTPYVMPKNLDISMVVEVTDPDEVAVHFGNPMGSNKIHYCIDPKITVRALAKDQTAKIISATQDKAVIAVYDKAGEITTGKVRFEVTGKVKAILGLEEFNSAPPSVQAAAYQLVLDRRLDEYIVPDDVYIMGMGNRDTDKGITYKMPTPIMNRFVHIEMKVDFDDWQRWALTHYIHPDVVGYLSAFKQQLFKFEPSSAARGFATPRSWEFVSDILNQNEDLSETILMLLVAGCIGDGDAAQFVSFRKDAKDLPKVEAILSGKVKKMPSKVEVALSYALAVSLCYELKERDMKIKQQYTKADEYRKSPERKQWLQEADTFLEFILQNFQPEICIMAAKAAIQIHKLPFDTQEMKKFDEFAERYKEYIMQ